MTNSDIDATYNLIVDIGTTTVGMALMKDSKEVFRNNFRNPQYMFGSDIISRIKACEGGKLRAMQLALVSELNRNIDKIKAQFEVENIGYMLATGNSAMQHIFFGVDCSTLGYSPYTPQFLTSKRCKSCELGFTSNFEVVSVPCISSFVGGDIVCGIYQCGLPKPSKYNILLDLGTNAEIAIWDKDICVVTSAAAGSCFEGANISCGMSAFKGAIAGYKVSIVQNKAEVEVKTVGDTKPIGLCGSGLIDVIAEMIDGNVIDKSGMFLNNRDSFEICDDIRLTQNDVREFQLAKSAIRAGLEALIAKLQLTANDIDTLFLAGGFSTYINTENAVKCGMLPWRIKDKCKPSGNSSLSGAVKYFEKNKADMLEAEKIVKKSSGIDLSCNKMFADGFIKYMNFDEN